MIGNIHDKEEGEEVKEEQSTKMISDISMRSFTPDEHEDFAQLKEGDFIVVKWSDYWVKHTPGARKIMAYNVADVNQYDNEIICQKKDNHYFNWNLYLEGRSSAEEVLIIIDTEEGE